MTMYAVALNLRSLWRDDRGAIAATEMIVMGTIVILGAIVGLAGLRDSVVQELGDVSAATAELSQGFSYSAIQQDQVIDNLQYRFSIGGSSYVDNADFGVPNPTDPHLAPPMCISISADEIQNEQ